MPERDADADESIELGDFTFAPASGALRDRRDGSEVRLGPKPSALLELLVAKRGAVATREQLREHLWPDVNVDFDASLHHCVRQVRAALGDRASSPRYIETIPRRGYRLVCPIEAVVASANADAAPQPQPPDDTPAPEPELLELTEAPSSSRRAAVRRRSLLVGVVAVASAGLATWWWRSSAPAPIRLGIMSFAQPSMSPAAAIDANLAGAKVLVGLTHALGARVDVVGPRTTEPLRERGSSLAEVAAALALDHLLNIRHTGGAGSDEVLAELIRADDGRHVWVERFSRLDESGADLIIAGVTGELGQ